MAARLGPCDLPVSSLSVLGLTTSPWLLIGVEVDGYDRILCDNNGNPANEDTPLILLSIVFLSYSKGIPVILSMRPTTLMVLSSSLKLIEFKESG